VYSPKPAVLDFDLEALGLVFLQGGEVSCLTTSTPDCRQSKTGTSPPALRVQKPLTITSFFSFHSKKKEEQHYKLVAKYGSLPDLAHFFFSFNITAVLLRKKNNKKYP